MGKSSILTSFGIDFGGFSPRASIATAGSYWVLPVVPQNQGPLLPTSRLQRSGATTSCCEQPWDLGCWSLGGLGGLWSWRWFETRTSGWNRLLKKSLKISVSSSKKSLQRCVCLCLKLLPGRSLGNTI